ncbi:MAG: hypothetical protein KBA40_01655 [Candidatus Peribacteraceae bacterium]|nr:hypothetical protein [Candidatus Peribacteraceae bacterium]MBP9850468.1 hypothetical protein [Candidatus Peribacteraceae bacterium]
MLTPREIIAQAWTVTTTEPSLKWWGFTGSALRLLLDIKLVGYQIYFLYSYTSGVEVGMFDDVTWLYHNAPLSVFWFIMITFGILVISELFVPMFCDGAIIGLAAKAHKKERVSGGFVLGLYNFFPIFAIHELFIFSGVNLLITAISIILRYGSGLEGFMIIIASILWLFSSILRFLGSFAEPAVVINKIGVFPAIGQSVKLTFSYPGHIIFLILLLLIITIRIFVNLVILVLIPALVIGLGIVLTYFLTPMLSYTIAGVVALILTLVAAYFFMYMHVFKEAVWTIMYVELTSEKELDKIG